VDVVLHLGRGVDGVRRLRQVAVPERGPSGLVSMVPALEVAPDGAATIGPAAERLATRLGQ
jgi:pilus assembly protein CpaF